MATKGQVKWFDPKKGFGFIVGPKGEDVFVHYTHIDGAGFRTLRDGEEVSYSLIESDKGLQAREVHPTNTEGQSGAPEMGAQQAIA